MQLKILFNQKFIIIFLGVVLTLMLFLYFFPHRLNIITYTQPDNSSSFFVPNTYAYYGLEKNDYSSPLRIKIPSIKVDAIIENVGLAKDGSVGVPKGPKTAAWFNLSSSPGATGSSVVSGHSGWRNGIPAVFDNLYKLKKGDKIYVENDKGEATTFVVREIKRYDPKAQVPDVFFLNDGKAHLNLITCTGIWSVINKSRSERLVVFTDKE